MHLKIPRPPPPFKLTMLDFLMGLLALMLILGWLVCVAVKIARPSGLRTCTIRRIVNRDIVMMTLRIHRSLGLIQPSTSMSLVSLRWRRLQ